MSKLKHYKGDGWEVKVKYDWDTEQLLWTNQKGIHLIDRNVTYQVINMIDAMTGNWRGSKTIPAVEFEWLTDHLDKLTAPKIINERTFDNPNFKIRIWETEDKIGAETFFVGEKFEYIGDVKISYYHIYTTFIPYTDEWLAEFKTKTIKEIDKSEIAYTYTDLYKALERAEQETSELTYETVVKELEGLQGQELYEAMLDYEYSYILNNEEWYRITRLSLHFFNMKETVERGLIKLRRAE